MSSSMNQLQAGQLAACIETKYPRSRGFPERGIYGHYIVAYVFVGGRSRVFHIWDEGDLVKIDAAIADSQALATVKRVAEGGK